MDSANQADREDRMRSPSRRSLLTHAKWLAYGVVFFAVMIVLANRFPAWLDYLLFRVTFAVSLLGVAGAVYICVPRIWQLWRSAEYIEPVAHVRVWQTRNGHVYYEYQDGTVIETDAEGECQAIYKVKKNTKK